MNTAMTPLNEQSGQPMTETRVPEELVERGARAIHPDAFTDGPFSGARIVALHHAKRALEASHHAELVEFVRWVSRGKNQVAILADELLAKIGGAS